MKILMIAGLGESLINFRGSLIKAFQKKGFEVNVVAPDLPVNSRSRIQLQDLGIKVHVIAMSRTGVNPIVDFMYLLSLYRLMRSIKPGITFAYTAKPVIFGNFAAFLSGVSERYVLITGLGYAFADQPRGFRAFVKFVIQALYRLSLRFANKVFFQNPDDEALFREMEIIPKFVPSVVVNGSGVDLDQYTLTPLPEGSFRFLFVGRFLGDKGIREYVDAAKRVKKAYPEIHFSLVGWIDKNPDAIEQAELDKWMDDGIVNYLGRLADVRPAISNSSVFVLPSYREGVPRTVLEAMAMGRPILTTDAPGCRETTIDGENGYIVPIRSVDHLENAMLRFIRDPEICKSMGKRSREIAESKYDVNKVNNLMLAEMGFA